MNVVPENPIASVAANERDSHARERGKSTKGLPELAAVANGVDAVQWDMNSKNEWRLETEGEGRDQNTTNE